MAANIIESFFVSLGFEIDTGKLDEFEQQVAGARNAVLAVGAVAAAAAGAIGVFVTKVAEGIDELGDFAEIEQVSIEALQEVGYAAQLSGSSLDAVKASVAGVNKTVGEAALGIGRGAQTFEKLGMSAKNADGSIKSFDQVLEEVAARMDGLSRQEQIALAEKLGIDRSLIPLLAKGRGELEKLREEARAFGLASEEDAQKAGELMDSLDRTRFVLGALGKYIAVGFMPQVTAVLDGFREWLVTHQKIIKSGIGNALKAVTAIIGTLWDWTVRLADGLVGLVKWLIDFKVVVYAAAAAAALFASVQVFTIVKSLIGAFGTLTGTIAGFNATALLIPAIIGAIIIALGLLIDDYVNWKEGNESVIGDLVEQFPWLLGMIESIEQAVGAFVDFWLQQWETLKEPLGQLGQALWKLISVLAETLWPVIKMIFTGWGYLIAAFLPIVIRLFALIVEGWTNIASWAIAAFSLIVEGWTNLTQWIVAFAQFAIDAIVAYFTWWAQTVAAIYEFIVGVVGKVVDTVMGGVKGAVEWVMGLIDTAKQKVMGFIDSVAGAIGKVGQLLGLTDRADDVKIEVKKSSAPEASTPAPTQAHQAVAQSPADQVQPPAPAQPRQPTPIAQAVAQSPAMQAQPAKQPAPVQAVPALQLPGGVIGRAGNTTTNTSTVTQTTTITAPITINSPDPAKAGESVRQELGRLNKQAVRNGQTAVAL